MWRLSGQRARWITAVARLAPLLLFLAGCASVPSYQKYVGPVSATGGTGPNRETFQTLWEDRTVYFGRGTSGGGSGIFGTGFSALGGPGTSAIGFPLDIAATFMDSLLLEAGFQHYSSLLEMSPQEQANFREAYQRLYDPAHHILIWCRLRTTWAELHLDLDRWTIFIEVQDDELNQYEPVEVLEEKQIASPAMMEVPLEFDPGPGPAGRQVHQKSIMLCFPRQDLLNNPVLPPKAKTLTLVFQENADQKTKAEGTWVLRK
jgi:hypothetical protein